MPWVILVIAGLVEAAWAVGLKYSEGFSRLWPSLITVAAIVVSLALLSVAARSLPIGTAYGIWVGIGAAGAVVLGIFLFDEPASLPRLAFLVLLIVAIVGLKLTSH